MSTGGEQKKPTELLVALGINEIVSKKNIHTYLKQLKNIPSQTINLDVKGYNSQLFIDYGKQIQALEQQVDSLNEKLTNIGTDASAPLAIFEDVKQQMIDSIKAIDTLNETFDDLKINVSSFYKQLVKIPTNDLQTLRKLITQLKTEMETVAINQFKLNGIQGAQQDLQILETNLSSIYELQTSYIDTSSFEQLTAQVAELNNQLTNIQLGEGLSITGISDISRQIEKMNQDIIAFGSNANAAAKGSTNFLTSIIDGTARAVELTELINKIRPTTVEETTTNNSGTGGTAVGGLAAIGKGLLATTGVGAGLLAVEWLISQSMNARAEAKQFAQEMEIANQQMLESYGQNSDTLDELVPKYERLSEIVNKGHADNSTLTEYHNIQNEIANLLPSLAAGEDELGNKVIGSSDALKVKLELLKEQLEIEKEKKDIEETNNRDKRIPVNEKELVDISKQKNKLFAKVESRVKMANNLYHNDIGAEYIINLVDSEGNPAFNTVEKIEKKLEDVTKKRKTAEQSGDSDLANYYSRLEGTFRTHLKDLEAVSSQENEYASKLKLDYIDSIEAIILKNNELSDSEKVLSQTLSASLIKLSDVDGLSDVKDALSTMFSENLSEDANKIVGDITTAFSSLSQATSEEGFNKASEHAKKILEDLPSLLKDVIKNEEDRAAVINVLNNAHQKAVDEQKRLGEEAKKAGMSIDQYIASTKDGSEGTDKFSQSADEATNALEKQVKKLKELSSAQEQIVGVSDAQTKAVSDSITVIEFLGNVSERTEKQELSLANSLKLLSALYPQLTNLLNGTSKQREQAIAIITAENKANQALLSAYALVATGKMSVEGKATMVHLEETNKRINTINAEIRALDQLQSSHAAIINNRGKVTEEKGKNFNDTDSLIAERLASQAYEKTKFKQAELATLAGTQSSDADSLLSIVDAIGKSDKATSNVTKTQKGATKALKDSNATLKESIYITDKYKQKLEELNFEIEKQQHIAARVPKHSKEYQNALDEQIKFEKEKLRVLKEQEASLRKQVESGKIQKTGVLTGMSPTQSSKSGTVKPKGWSGTITSGYGKRGSEMHNGIDIDGKIGDVLEANVNGKVLKAGNADTIGEHGSYGNLVIIEDTNSNKHYYAHMNDIAVVKGQQITAGTKLGTIGNTGNVDKSRGDGSHLHYGVKSGNSWIDPSNYIQQAKNGVQGNSTQATVWNYFRNKGLNDNAISGIMGNIAQESNFNASAVNKTSGASGLLQWFGSRRIELENYAKSLGKSWNDIQVQLDFAWKELNGSKKNALTSLQRNDLTVSQHASEFERLFEHSGGSAVGKRQDYANQYYSQFADSNGAISIFDTSQEAIDQGISNYLNARKEVRASESSLVDLYDEKVRGSLSYYDALIAGIDRSIKMSNILANQQLEHSQAYRIELENETKHQKYKQSLLHKEANFIREQLKRTDLSLEFKDELSVQLSELSLSWWDIQENIEGIDEQIENSKINEFDRKIEQLNDTISQSNTLMSLYTKGSKEYNNEQKNIISALYSKQKAYEAEAEALRLSLQLEKLSNKEIEQKTNRLKELSSAWLEVQSEIVQTNSSIADELISAMKEAYSQQRDYALALKDKEIKTAEDSYKETVKYFEDQAEAYEDSIKKQMQDLDTAHKDKMDKLEKESKAFEEAINRQLELMRKQRDEEGFNKEIEKLQKEETTIVSKINELSMDDSREAKLQRKKLEEELVDIQEQIAEKQSDRQYELREQNLQDELDSYQTQYDAIQELEDNNYNAAKDTLDKQLELYNNDLNAKKELEEKKYKETQDRLDKERRDIVNHYTELINNEQSYAELRSQIINGNVDGMSTKLSGFLDSFKMMNKDVLLELGLIWQDLENQIYRITQVQGSLSSVSVPSPNLNLNNGSLISNSNTHNSKPNNTYPRDDAWQKYLANKKAWDSASNSEKVQLNYENEKLRKQWGFQDGSYEVLKNLKKYHNGGIVGGKGNRLTELTHKLFNTKPSEETVLALKRELMVPESNISNMFTNIRAVMPDFTKLLPQGSTIHIDNLLSIDSVSQNANLDIERLLDQGMNRLIDKMKPYGFKLR
ncbi:phage tail tip lysozyme [Lysinibacillus capsici]|uniref:phage tail tip lysozyme n=1 Tax=Lysinibacillus capsici TaxID=2115968 RepID=UPI003686923F